MILIILNFVKKSLQTELDDFFKLVGNVGKSISKQGISEVCLILEKGKRKRKKLNNQLLDEITRNRIPLRV